MSDVLFTLPFIEQIIRAIFWAVPEEAMARVTFNLDAFATAVTISAEKNCSSILMWSHYADSHKGAVLALDAKHSFFQDHAFDPVEYSDEKVFLDPTWDEQSKERQSYNRDVIRRKSVQWKYEDEIRALYRLDTCNKTIIGESTLYFVKIPAELFKKVVFGAKCSAGYREKVKSLAIQQKLNVQFEEVVLHEDQSELRFRPM